MIDKTLLHKICEGLRLRQPHSQIAKNCGCSPRTVQTVARNKPKRVLFFADSHCGSNVGLTPPSYQYPLINAPKSEEARRRNKWAKLQRECWDWYTAKLKELNPVDKTFLLGDLIDGVGCFSGGTEQITTDRQVQVAMAIETLELIDTTGMIFTYGTAVHTGKEEDFEAQIADHFNSKIGSHEWESINGCVFDLKHHQSGTKNPFTSLYNETTANLEWATVGEQPKADVLVRAHTHKFCLARTEGSIAMTLPALQSMGSRYGQRRCTRKVNFGLVVFDVWPDGECVENVFIANLKGHKTKAN